jgi:hypothetical protein
LTGDLDCTGYVGNVGAVLVSRRASFELRGFTVTGGDFGIVCGTVRPDSEGHLGLQLDVSCTIRGGGGTVRATASHGMIGSQIKVYDLHVKDAGQEGIYATKKGMLENVTVSGSAGQGVRIEGAAMLRATTITGSAEDGIVALRTLRAIDSDLRGNGTGPQCPGAFNCADVRAARRPHLVRSACDRSRGAGPTGYGAWGVCVFDFD